MPTVKFKYINGTNNGEYMNSIIENKIAFYRKDIDNPFSVNGFKGTWNFSDHSLIPSILTGFLTRYFGVARIKRVSLDDINKVMNEVWEGPGSLEKIFMLEYEMQESGKTIKLDPRDYAKKNKKDEEGEEFEFEEMDELPLNSFGGYESEEEDE